MMYYFGKSPLSRHKGDPYATDLERAGVRNTSPKRMCVRISSTYRRVSHGASHTTYHRSHLGKSPDCRRGSDHVAAAAGAYSDRTIQIAANPGCGSEFRTACRQRCRRAECCEKYGRQ